MTEESLISQSFNSFRENCIPFCSTPINLSLSAGSSCGVIFDFLEEFNLDHLHFTRSSFSIIDASCVTTTHSISLPCQSKYLSLSYFTLKPILSTVVHETFPKKPLDPLLHKELCPESEKQQPLSSISFKKLSSSLNFKVNTSKYSGSQLSSNQNHTSKEYNLSMKLKRLLKQFSLSDFESKYGLSSNLVSELPTDIRFWSPPTYNFYFPSCAISHLPNYITIYLKDNTGRVIEIVETPKYHSKGMDPQSVIFHFGDGNVLHYLSQITLNFVNLIPLNIIFPPYVTLDTDRKVVLNFNHDRNHLERNCANVIRMRLPSNGKFMQNQNHL